MLFRLTFALWNSQFCNLDDRTGEELSDSSEDVGFDDDDDGDSILTESF